MKNAAFLLSIVLISSCGAQDLPKAKQLSVKQLSGGKTIVRSQGIKSGVVKAELVDDKGNTWFLISGEGIYRYDGQTFRNFTVNDGLPSNKVEAILQDHLGNILIGTDKGIWRFQDGKTLKLPIPDTLRITCMLEDKDNKLWFGTMSDGVFRFDGKHLENYLNKEHTTFNYGKQTQLILDILQDKKGNIWFSSWNGGGVWMYNGTEFKNFVPDAEYYTSNQDKRDITESYGQLKSYTHSPDHISDDMIFSVMEDDQGNIWFGTRDHGACRYDGKSFKSFGKSEGLDARGTYKILQDKNGDMWFSTEESGVWRFDGTTFQNFDRKDGLVNNAVLSMIEDRKGDLWFGTKWFGLSRFDGKVFTTFSQAE